MIVKAFCNCGVYMHNNICMLSDLEELFKRHDCDCIEVEMTDFQRYTDIEHNPVIPDAVIKVKFTF